MLFVQPDRIGGRAEHLGVVALVHVLGRAHLREGLVGSAPGLAALDEVVVGAVDRAQAVGEQEGLGRRGGGIGIEPTCLGHELAQVAAGRMRLGDLDLLQDEFEIVLDEIDHDASPPTGLSPLSCCAHWDRSRLAHWSAISPNSLPQGGEVRIG